MQISNQYLIIIIIIAVIVIWYAKNAYYDVDRYKKIIDKYIDSKNDDHNKKKSAIKKVSIIEPTK